MTTPGRREKCLGNLSGKGHPRGLRARQMRNWPLPGASGDSVDQTRLNPCQPRPVGLNGALDRRVKTEIPDDALHRVPNAPASVSRNTEVKPVVLICSAIYLLVAGCAGAGSSVSRIPPPVPTVAARPPLNLCPVADVPPHDLAGKPGYAQFTVSVTDISGEPIRDLKQSDLTVTNGGRSLPVQFFCDNSQGTPMSLAVLVDTSGSMEPKLTMRSFPELREIWNQFADVMARLNQCDEIATWQFGGSVLVNPSEFPLSERARLDPEKSEVRLVEPLTTDHELGLVRLTYMMTYGMTPLYDAIHEGLHTLAAAHYPDRALLIITDGIDSSSKRAKEAVFAEAQQSGIPIYAIGLGDPNAPESGASFSGEGGGNAIDLGTLKGLSYATGGRTFVASPIRSDRGATFIKSLASFAEILGQSYSIGVVIPPGSLPDHAQPEIRVRNRRDTFVTAHQVLRVAARMDGSASSREALASPR